MEYQLPALQEIVGLKTLYHVECIAPDGRVKWVEDVYNLITTEGLNDLLTKYFKGSGYTATWYVGLVDGFDSTEAFAAGDTAAEIDGTNGWNELQSYDEANRQDLTLGTASSGSIDNTGNVAAFTISATVTVEGAFIISDNTKGGTTGVLYGEAAFSAARSAVDNDTLNVTVTLTASSA